MPTAPISFPSVADRWATAWGLPMYQIAPPDFDDRLMSRLEAPAAFLRMLHGTSLTALGVALTLGLRGEEPARLQAMAERARPVLDGVVAALGNAEPVIAEQVFEIRLYLTLLARAARPALPARPVLRDIASDRCRLRGLGARARGIVECSRALRRDGNRRARGPGCIDRKAAERMADVQGREFTVPCRGQHLPTRCKAGAGAFLALA
jgi:hypothetical protein